MPKTTLSRFPVRLIATVGALLFLAGASSLFILHRGIPSPLKGVLLQRISSEQFKVSADRVYATFLSGVVAENVSVADRQGREVARAERVRVSIDLRSSLADSRPVAYIHLTDGKMTWPPGALSDQLPALEIEEAAMRLDREQLVLHDLAGRFGSAHVHITGSLRGFSSLSDRSGAPAGVPPDLVKRFREYLEPFTLESEPRLAMRFAHDFSQPGSLSIDCDIKGKNVAYEKFTTDAYHVILGWESGQLNMPLFSVRKGKKAVRASCRYTLSNGHVEVAAQSDLSYESYVSLLPRAWKKRLRDAALKPSGEFTLSVSAGPAPFDQVLNHVRGSLYAEALAWKEIRLDRVDADFERNGDILTIQRASAALPMTAPPQPVEAGFRFDLASKTYEGRLHGRCDPGHFKTLMPDRLEDFLDSLRFSGPPSIDAEVSGSIDQPDSLRVAGQLLARDLKRYEVPVAYFDTRLDYADGLLTLEPLHGIVTGESLRGSVRQNFTDSSFTLHLLSAAPPPAVARLIHPDFEALLKRFQFSGPARIEADAVLGYGENRTRELDAQCRIDGLGVGRFVADRADFHYLQSGSRIAFEDMNANWCNGRVTGSLVLNPGEEPGTQSLATDLMLDGADFQKVIQSFQENADSNAFLGTLSGNLTFFSPSGALADPTAEGVGRIVVHNGYILTIPLFGGLSKYLSLLKPGLGYSAERDLTADFRIDDGMVHVTDFQLLGRFVTISGSGTYSLDTRQLDFLLQVRFLQEGLTGEAVRLLTSPATSLLRFRLTGTPREPAWTLVNSPHHLLQFFKKAWGKLPLPHTTL